MDKPALPYITKEVMQVAVETVQAVKTHDQGHRRQQSTLPKFWSSYNSRNSKKQSRRTIPNTAIFNWAAKEKCVELKQFKLEVTNIFLSKLYIT